MRAPKEGFDFVHQFLTRMCIDDLHAKRVLSLSNGALGVMTGAALAASLIGQALTPRSRCTSSPATVLPPRSSRSP
jgi:hypothetical protein